jgi:integrase
LFPQKEGEMAFEPLFVDVKGADKYFGIKQKKLKELKDSGRIRGRKEGKRMMYLFKDLKAYTLADCSKLDLNKINDDTVIKKEVGLKRAKEESPNSVTENKRRSKMWTETKNGAWLNCGDMTLLEIQGKGRNKGRVHYMVDYRIKNGNSQNGKENGKKIGRLKRSIPRIIGQEINSRKEAVGALALVRHKIYEETQEPIQEKEDHSVSEFIPIYLEEKKADRERSYNGVETAVRNQLEPFLGDVLLKDLTLDWVKKYRDHRRRAGVKDSSIWNNELSHLRELYKLAQEKGYVSGNNPVQKGKLKLKIEKRERYMRPEEEKIIWPILRKYPPLEDLADLILHTAMRPSNECDLQWSWIRWKNRRAIVPREFHKQKTIGQYLLDRKVIKMLKRRREEADKFDDDFPYVFWREENGSGKRIKVTTRWIQDRWVQVMEEAKEALEKAGEEARLERLKALEEREAFEFDEEENGEVEFEDEIEEKEDLHFYDLKHTCLTRLAAKGASVFLLQAVSNHLCTASLEHYVKPYVLKEPALDLLDRMCENGD